MTMKKWILVVALCSSSSLMGQQMTRWSQYFFQPMLINNASAGAYKYWNISAGFKSMWNSIPGAPQTQYFSVDGTLLDGRVGVGAIVDNDEAGLLTQKRIQFNGNYRYRINQDEWLSAGVGLGLKHHLVDGAKSTFQTSGDPALATTTLTDWAPATSVGVFYQSSKATAGFSVENAFRYKINYTKADRMIEGQSVARLNFMGSYRFQLNKDFDLIANALLKIEPRNTAQLDITPLLVYKKVFKLGLGFRPGESLSLILQNQITPRLSAGYAYDFQTNRLNSVTNGSHELVLRYLLVRKNKLFIAPRAF